MRQAENLKVGLEQWSLEGRDSTLQRLGAMSQLRRLAGISCNKTTARESRR